MSKIILYQNWFVTENPIRQQEYEEALQKNLDNELIDQIVLIGVKFPEHKKINTISFPRPTYTDFLNIIRSTPKNESSYNIIANTDIYFDDTLAEVPKYLRNNEVYALTRWDPVPPTIHENLEVQKPRFSLWKWRKHSQDSWIFNGTPKRKLKADYYLGIPGCDNNFAHKLYQCGYHVSNPSLSIKSYHVHTSQIRTYQRNVDRVPPPYRPVNPSSLPFKKSSDEDPASNFRNPSKVPT